MSDSILDKFGRGKSHDTGDETVENAEHLEDLGAFGYLRGIRDRAIMLELRHKDGRISAFAYAHLSQVQFDPSEGIVLYFGASIVRIFGQRLDTEIRPNLRLFAGITRHRVPWIRQSNRYGDLATDESTLVVSGIDVE